jgi:hypothetical protein
MTTHILYGSAGIQETSKLSRQQAAALAEELLLDWLIGTSSELKDRKHPARLGGILCLAITERLTPSSFFLSTLLYSLVCAGNHGDHDVVSHNG